MFGNMPNPVHLVRKVNVLITRTRAVRVTSGMPDWRGTVPLVYDVRLMPARSHGLKSCLGPSRYSKIALQVRLANLIPHLACRQKCHELSPSGLLADASRYLKGIVPGTKSNEWLETQVLYILMPLLLSMLTTAPAWNPAHWKVPPTAPPTVLTSSNRLSKNASVSLKSVL